MVDRITVNAEQCGGHLCIRPTVEDLVASVPSLNYKGVQSVNCTKLVLYLLLSMSVVMAISKRAESELLDKEGRMTLTLELPKELESDLVNEAAQLGMSLPDYTLRLLFARPALKAAPQNGAELVAYWQNAGVIGMRSDIDDSQQHARTLRVRAGRRQQDGAR